MATVMLLDVLTIQQPLVPILLPVVENMIFLWQRWIQQETGYGQLKLVEVGMISEMESQ